MRYKSGLGMAIITLGILMVWIVPAAADWGKWSPGGIGVCTAAQSQGSVGIATDGAGGSIIAWIDYRDNAYHPNIYAQKLDANGNPIWQANGIKIADYSYFGYIDTPRVVSDGNGGAIIVFTCHGSYPILCAQRVGADGTLLWGTTGVTLLTGSSMEDGCVSVDAIPGGSGGVIVAFGWYHGVYNPDKGWYNYHKYISVQRLNADGNTPWPYGPVTFENGVDTPNRYPRVISDGADGCIVAWVNQDGDVRAARISSGGTTQWANQVNIGSYTLIDGDTNSPQIVPDGSGGALISWNHRQTYAYGQHWYYIYAQRISSSGATQWAADKLISTVYPTDADQRVISDNAGGAIYVFGSKDPSPPAQEYKWLWAQRLDGNGNRLWSDYGVLIAEITLVGKEFTAATDGSGGVIAAWSDARVPSNYDIFAERLDASGAKKWGPSGLPICTESHRQGYPAIAYHGNDGVVIAWEDTRAGNNDVYAQRMDNCYLEITDVAVNTTFDSQTYTWDATITFESNMAATSVVAYDPDMDCYPACSYSHQQAGPEETQHTIVLADLAAANEYCYKITVESDDDPLDCPATVTGSFTLNNSYANIYSINATHIELTCEISVSWYTKFPSKQNTLYWRLDNTIPWQSVTAYQADCNGNRFYLARFPVSPGTDYEYKISTKIDNVTYQTGVFHKRSGRCDENPPIPYEEVSARELSKKPYLRSWPNPFNPQTTISFNLPEAAEIELKIFSISGECVRTLASGLHERAVHNVMWDGTNDRGESVSSGIYFARLTIRGAGVLNAKLLLLK